MELWPVLRCTDPSGPVFYLGTLRPAEIRQLTFVPAVPSLASVPPSLVDLPEGPGAYQRSGDPRRMEAIRAFISARSGCIVPPVVLSTRGQWEFVEDYPNSDVGRLTTKAAAAIIDGQHRLGGLWRLVCDGSSSEIAKEKLIPFMAVDGLSVADETVEFVDINDNQRGVKKSLIAWLELNESFAGLAAKALAGDEESVFRGRIDIQYKHAWDLILFGAMKECVALTFGNQLRTARSFDPEEDVAVRESALEMLLKYWRVVCTALPELWSDIEQMPPIGSRVTQERRGTKGFRYRLLEETGLRAFSKLAERLFVAAWQPDLSAPSWEVIEAALRGLGQNDRVRLVMTKPRRNPAVLEFDPLLHSTGKAGVEAIFRHLESELYSFLKH